MVTFLGSRGLSQLPLKAQSMMSKFTLFLGFAFINSQSDSEHKDQFSPLPGLGCGYASPLHALALTLASVSSRQPLALRGCPCGITSWGQLRLP